MHCCKSQIWRGQTALVAWGFFLYIGLHIQIATTSEVASLGTVSKIIHQSWKSADTPKKFRKWQQSWLALHPDWEYRLWTDEDNRRLVEEHYDWFLPTFLSLPEDIMRADAVRYLYMHRHGGLYVDLDFLALKNLDELLLDQSLVLGSLSDETDWNQNIPNAFLASAPSHPFWYFCLQEIVRRMSSGSCFINTTRWDWLESITGPIMLSRAISRYEEQGGQDLMVLPPGAVYPVDWRDTVWGPKTGLGDRWSICNPHHASFSPDVCAKKFPDSYAITFWFHTWGDPTKGA